MGRNPAVNLFVLAGCLLVGAVALNRASPRPAKIEASGGVSLDQLSAIAATGVDFISIGALTKHVQAIDMSLRLL